MLPPVRVCLVAVACLWLALAQVDGLLQQVQSADRAAGGMESVASGWPDAGMVQRTKDLAAVWRAPSTERLARASFWTYSALDVALVAAYVALFLALARRLAPLVGWVAPGRLKSVAARHPWWALGPLAGLDVAEDVLRLGIVLPRREPPDVLIWVSWGATTLKWFAAVAVLALLGALVHERRGEVAAHGRRLATALWRLRVLALPSLAFGALALTDPTQQGPDLVRRWLDGGGIHGAAAAGIAATLLLGAVLWAAARRMVLAPHEPQVAPVSQAWILRVALAFALAAVILDLRRLAGVAIVLGVVWAAAAVRRLVPLPEAVDAEREEHAIARGRADAAAPGIVEREALRRMARVLALWPPLALALGMVRSFSAPPLALISGGSPGVRWASALLAAAGAGLAVAVVVGGWHALSRLDARPPPRGVEAPYAVLVLACLVPLGLAIGWPLDVAPALGTITILATAMATLSLVAAEAQRAAEARPPPAGLQALGFTRTPLIALTIAVFVAASLVDRGDDYHAVHLTPGDAVARDGLDLGAAWKDWKRRSCASGAQARGRTIPLVIVAASGGGLRAAYWTASSLTALVPQPAASAGQPGCPRTRRLDRVFAMSGVSGGSLGLAGYASWARAPGDSDWYEEALGRPDFLATPATWLFVDVARATVGWRGPDRARRLEQAWERHVAGLDQGFLRLPRAPVLLLGGTKVESGCHLNVSALRLSDRVATSRQDECAALTTRSANVGSTRAPAAPATSEVLDHLCKGREHLRSSTAALLSARFPYITPSGRLQQCDQGPPETAVVDGGYAENTGVGAAIALWRQLEPLVAAHNSAGKGARVVPVFVELDNHYAKVAAPGVAGRTDELLTPPLARAHAAATGDREIEQEARSAFLADPPGLAGTRCWLPGPPDERTGTTWGRFVRVAPVVSPGLPAPLAWTLSQMSTDDLDRQREGALREREGKALADLLAGTSRLDCSS